MNTDTERRHNHRFVGDIVVSGTLLVVFAGALAMALGRTTEANLLPIGVSALGTALAGGSFIRALLERRRTAAQQTGPSADGEAEDDYIFAIATRTEWMQALGYLLGFIAVLYLLGMYAAAALFAVLYLRLQADRSWAFSVVYAAASIAFLYVVFTVALGVPVPSGVLIP